MSEALSPVVLTVAGSVATVTVNRPPLNLLSQSTKDSLTEVFSSFDRRDDLRVVILRGAGDRAFSAGADLNEFIVRIENGTAHEAAVTGQAMLRAVRTCKVPVVAVLDGYVFGAGLELALAADLRVASDRARLALPEVTRGVFPGNGGAILLTHLVGVAVAKEIMLLGDHLTAESARTYGLVNRVVPAEELHASAWELASRLAERPVEAVAAIRAVVDQLASLPLEEAFERQAHLFAEVFKAPAVREGVAAFRERRAPNFHSIPGER